MNNCIVSETVKHSFTNIIITRTVSDLTLTALTRYMDGRTDRQGDNSTYTFTKRGVGDLVSATPPKRLIGVL